jgi:hypothetical protein
MRERIGVSCDQCKPLNQSPAMDNVEGREAAQRLARSDPERALGFARAIRDPWYRCQALAWIARYAGPQIATVAFTEAIAAAAQGGDGYRRLAVLAWPIRAAIERGQAGRAAPWLHAALAEIATVEPMASRAYALGLLWSAAFPAGPQLRAAVRAAVLAHCPPDRSWRAARLYRTIVATLAAAHPEDGQALIAAMPGGKARTQVERRRAAGELGGPRAFFW